jgi:hypothetical protein
LYEYIGTGGIGVGGCSDEKATMFKYFRWGPGMTLFICPKAAQGTLEKITIKRINLVQNRRTYMKIIPVYVDTYNCLYNENELCTESEAISAATAYYSQQLIEINRLISSCSRF